MPLGGPLNTDIAYRCLFSFLRAMEAKTWSSVCVCLGRSVLTNGELDSDHGVCVLLGLRMRVVWG